MDIHPHLPPEFAFTDPHPICREISGQRSYFKKRREASGDEALPCRGRRNREALTTDGPPRSFTDLKSESRE
jgi:hypothetical protein